MLPSSCTSITYLQSFEGTTNSSSELFLQPILDTDGTIGISSRLKVSNACKYRTNGFADSLDAFKPLSVKFTMPRAEKTSERLAIIFVHLP